MYGHHTFYSSANSMNSICSTAFPKGLEAFLLEHTCWGKDWTQYNIKPL